MIELRNIDFFELESTIWVANRKVNIPTYDFQFEPLFKTAHPRLNENLKVETVARIGAIDQYDRAYSRFLELGFRLVNSPEQHRMASELESWYPYIKDLTPKSKVYTTFPTLNEIQKDFEFPVFIKGNRQTAKHNPALSIAWNKADFVRISKAYQNDSILHWQKVVVRSFVSLMPLKIAVKDKVQLSFEFRTFWWKQRLVGAGHYWAQYADYIWTEDQKHAALSVARKAVEVLEVPFIVIDLAMTIDEKWIIIECNDAQESGYCGVNSVGVWKEVVEFEYLQ